MNYNIAVITAERRVSMFKCQITGRNSRHGEKPVKVVVDTRRKEYKQQVFNEDTRSWEVQVLGVGWEIKKEINVSNDGLIMWNASDEARRAELLRNLK